LLAAAILALADSSLSKRLQAYREDQTRAVLAEQVSRAMEQTQED
jgi:phosphoribosylcarboxyaminoimidazole (NCAIR) mutase